MKQYTFIHHNEQQTVVTFKTFNQAIAEADFLNTMYRKQFEKNVFSRDVLESKLIRYVKGIKSTFCMY
tara:strand:+ start:209 stop:412 length:204 start_codon:yes stop_codon:yes gene_type:complete